MELSQVGIVFGIVLGLIDVFYTKKIINPAAVFVFRLFTRRRRKIRRLEWEIAYFERLLERQAIPVFRLDENLNLVYLNEPGLTLLKSKPGELAHRRWYAVLDDYHRTAIIESWEQARDDGAPYRRINRVRPNGDSFLIDVRAGNYQVGGKTSAFLGYFAVFPDRRQKPRRN